LLYHQIYRRQSTNLSGISSVLLQKTTDPRWIIWRGKNVRITFMSLFVGIRRQERRCSEVKALWNWGRLYRRAHRAKMLGECREKHSFEIYLLIALAIIRKRCVSKSIGIWFKIPQEIAKQQMLAKKIISKYFLSLYHIFYFRIIFFSRILQFKPMISQLKL